jgi:glutaredoxin 3
MLGIDMGPERSELEAMARAKIYTTPYCPYCHMAKALLTRKGVAFEEIDVSRRPDLRAEMTRMAGGRYTVPQIWIGEEHIGGCDDLYELDQEGGLDRLLAAASRAGSSSETSRSGNQER